MSRERERKIGLRHTKPKRFRFLTLEGCCVLIASLKDSDGVKHPVLFCRRIFFFFSELKDFELVFFCFVYPSVPSLLVRRKMKKEFQA